MYSSEDLERFYFRKTGNQPQPVLKNSNEDSVRIWIDIRERLQINSKKDVLGRETYSRNPINYSEGMADDQKDRYIQYLAGKNQEFRLTSDAMKLVYPFESLIINIITLFLQSNLS